MRCVAMKTKIVKFRTTPTQLHMKYQLWDLPVDRMRCEKYYCEEWQREKNWGSLYTTRNILRCRLLSNFPALTSLCCWLRWQRLLTTLWRTARTIEGGGEVLTNTNWWRDPNRWNWEWSINFLCPHPRGEQAVKKIRIELNHNLMWRYIDNSYAPYCIYALSVIDK